MLDVVTFGSASWDIFVRDDEFRFREEGSSPTGEEICSPLGSKIEIDEVRFFTGGGGTNALATFLAQGLKAIYCGSVGSDPIGEVVVNEIKKMRSDISLIYRIKDRVTNFSVIMSAAGKDRTVLAYRDAAEHLPIKKLLKEMPQTKWFYIAPLSGKAVPFFEEIVDFAKKKGVKVAVNLGKDQLKIPSKKLNEILSKTDILILNEEESSILSGVDYMKEEKLFKKITDNYLGTFVMTKGPDGSIVSDKDFIYKAGIIESKVVDRTGAGDSYGAGFVSSIISEKTTQEAIQFATANSARCLREWGAKNGLIKKGEKYKKVKVEIIRR